MELRDSPRYRVYLTVDIDGIELTANNISASGMQVSCPDFLYGRLQDTLESESFQVNTRLPMIETPCAANCKSVYHSEFGDEFLIGLQFLEFKNSDQQALGNYLQGLSDKNAPVVED